MRALLGHDLQEGEQIVVKNANSDTKRKVLIKINVDSDIEELAPQLAKIVPFPVIIERLPRRELPVRKRRKITREIILKDDADVMKRLFNI